MFCSNSELAFPPFSALHSRVQQCVFVTLASWFKHNYAERMGMEVLLLLYALL